MVKPTTGHVQPPPQPDPDQMAADTLMTSVFSGISLVLAVVVYATLASAAMHLVGRESRTTAMVAFGVGLALGAVIIALLLRRFADALKARSRNLYRGAWIGSVSALVIMVLMYFLPWIAFPVYCPPGALCQ